MNDIGTSLIQSAFYSVKNILGEVEVQGNRFFDRVALDCSMQSGASGQIDFGLLLSIVLLLNQEQYEISGLGILYDSNGFPLEAAKNPQIVLDRFVQLTGGDPVKLSAMLEGMANIMADIVRLWDVIERELPYVREWRYRGFAFVKQLGATSTLFSDAPQKYAVPQALMFPFVAAFIALVEVEENGAYGWVCDPFEAWADTKKEMFSELRGAAKLGKGNLELFAYDPDFWRSLNFQVAMYRLAVELEGLPPGYIGI